MAYCTRKWERRSKTHQRSPKKPSTEPAAVARSPPAVVTLSTYKLAVPNGPLRSDRSKYGSDIHFDRSAPRQLFLPEEKRAACGTAAAARGGGMLAICILGARQLSESPSAR